MSLHPPWLPMEAACPFVAVKVEEHAPVLPTVKQWRLKKTKGIVLNITGDVFKRKLKARSGGLIALDGLTLDWSDLEQCMMRNQ